MARLSSPLQGEAPVLRAYHRGEVVSHSAELVRGDFAHFAGSSCTLISAA